MVDRRDFLKITGAGFCGLLSGLPDELLARIQDVNDPLSSYPYRAWEDFYRKEFAATRGNSAGLRLPLLQLPGQLRVPRVRQGRRGDARGAARTVPADQP